MTDSSPPQQRHPLEAIASHLAESIRGGHRPEIDPIVADHPELESDLRGLLPVIQRLEHARRSQSDRPGGLVSLGSDRPQRLGDFELTRQIGRGGMGVVFEALQRSLNRVVAVKVLPKSLLVDQTQFERFKREARTAGSLHHTNIVPVFGVGEDQGFHYFVMQRIFGKGLDRAIADGQSFSPREVAHLGRQAAAALSYAHEQNILHRDVKPANLIVDPDLQLWVTDFGVSKAIESEAATRTGDVVGTLRYMAPEQIVGVTDIRSDLYSLGVTLYELLAGKPALDDAALREALIARRPAPEPQRLRQLNPQVPRDLETILRTAMAVELGDRYQSANELADDLQRYLDGGPISVRRQSAVEQATRWARRNPALAALSALTVLLAASVTVLSTFGYVHVQSALRDEKLARGSAEASATLATGALDQIFERFSVGFDDPAGSSAQFSAAPALSDEVAELLENLLNYYDALAAQSESNPMLQRSAARARYAMGDIHFQLGNHQKSIEAFGQSLEDLRQDFTATASERHLLQARIHNRIGLDYRMLGKDELAIQQHQAALKLLEPHLTLPVAEQQAIRFELAGTHYLLAGRVRPGVLPTTFPPQIAVLPEFEVSSPQPLRPRPSGRERSPRAGERSPARPNSEQVEQLQKAIELLEPLSKDHPDHVGYSLGLAASLRQLVGDSLAERAEDESKIENRAIQLLRGLHQRHPNDTTVRREYAAALAEFTVFQDDLSFPQIESAIERLREAVSLYETLSEENPNVPAYTNRLAHAYFKLGIMLERFADVDIDGPHELQQEAGAAFRQASQRYRTLIRQSSDAPGYQAWNALFLQHQGENAIRIGMFDQAERVLNRSVGQWHELTAAYPDEAVTWLALRESYRLLSHAQRRLDKHEEAEKSRLQADLVDHFHLGADPR